jgi:hypothetical protein
MEALFVVYPKEQQKGRIPCFLLSFDYVTLPVISASIGEHVPPTQGEERAGERKRRAIADQCAVSADERKGLDPYKTSEKK